MSEFSAVIQVSSLNGTTGFRLDGVGASDQVGRSVSSAGDINGDGFDDIVVSARFADPNGLNAAGSSYVVFGRAGGFSPTFALSGLNGSNGFRIDGAAAEDYSGFSVSSAGDVNGDGFDDVIVGAYGADVNGSRSGSSYVVFGKAGGFSAALNVSSTDGSNGFRLHGGAADDRSGFSVSSAGDVNGDGIDDLLVGARGADPNGISNAGSSYVVFGKTGGFGVSLNLSSLTGSNGFRIDGVTANDGSGCSVSSAGDINGDGIDDLIIGAGYADPGGLNASGSSYVVFGRAGGFGPSLNLAGLDGSNGFRLDGSAAADYSGFTVSDAGDVNGDGFDDLVVGARYADPNGLSSAGASYVVFGKAGGFGPTLSLSSLNGSNGFRIEGVAGGDLSGFSVSSAGDVNGDGFDDVIIGAQGADPNGLSSAGSSYVVFGKAGGFGARMSLADLDGTTGFRIDGAAASENSGFAVSSAGDVNGDGFDDILVGAVSVSPNGVSSAGAGYVIYGRAPDSAVSRAGSGGNNTIRGGAFDDTLDGLAGNDNLFGGAGRDVLRGGIGNDRLAGGAGADLMQGDAGNDTYAVDSVDDYLREFVDEGTDTVLSSITYALGANLENLTLIGAGAINGTGNTLDNLINGNGAANTLNGGAGSDTLNGGRGADTLIGGSGHDSLIVDNAGDRVVEASGGGVDKVFSSVSYALQAGQEIEALQLLASTGSAALNLTGNAISQSLVGNNGANVLNGGVGADAMTGRGGNDIYIVDNLGDQVREAVGGGTDTVLASASYALAAGQEIEALQLLSSTGSARLNLNGNAFGQSVVGNSGANVLDGKGGADVLTGRSGADSFLFSTALGSGNVDRIADFASEDTVRLAKSVFSVLATGQLSESAFKNASTGSVDASDRILYKQATGELFYDADGSGSGAAVRFAVLENKAALTHADFLIV